MKTESIVPANDQSPITSPVATRKTLSPLPGKAYDLGWMRYWATLPLVLANPFSAEASTTENGN